MNIKDRFPFFIQNDNFVYLDSASTVLKLDTVIQETLNYYSNYSFNNRSILKTEVSINDKMWITREKFAKYINCSPNEVIFNSGATEGLNFLAYGLLKQFKPNDKIIINKLEHASNFLPWIKWSKYFKIEIDFVDIDLNFQININDLLKKIDNNTKVLSLSSTFNTVGSSNDLDLIIRKIKQINPKIIVVVDATQTLGYYPLNVKELNIDFLVCSAHKMFGPTGLGVLFGKKDLLDNLEPLVLGGGITIDYDDNSIKYKELPYKLEPGTKNISAILAFDKALDFLIDSTTKEFYKNLLDLQKYGIEQLKQIRGIKIYNEIVNGTTIIFNYSSYDPDKVANFLSSKNILLRSGNSCVKTTKNTPINQDRFLRISLHFYSTKEDIDALVEALKKFDLWMINESFSKNRLC